MPGRIRYFWGWTIGWVRGRTGKMVLPENKPSIRWTEETNVEKLADEAGFDNLDDPGGAFGDDFH